MQLDIVKFSQRTKKEHQKDEKYQTDGDIYASGLFFFSCQEVTMGSSIATCCLGWYNDLRGPLHKINKTLYLA